ncbi:MAG: phage tail protein [Christensenellales bacterium]|jgi:archaellum component FlaC
MNYRLYANDELIFASDWADPDYQLISPIIKMEVNKAGSVEFTMLPRHSFYDKLPTMKTRIDVYRDEELIFSSRVLRNNADTYKQRKVYCEGMLAYLVDSIFGPSKGTRTAEEHFRLLVDSHNAQVEDTKKFTVGSIEIDEKTESHIFGEDNYRETFSAIQSDLIDSFGGYLRIRYENGVRYIDYLKSYNATSSQTIEFGQNLIDLMNEQTGEDLFTVLLPIGKDKLTIEAAGDSQKYTHNGKYLENTEAIAIYGRIVKTEDFGDITDAGTLMEKAEKYMTDNYKGIPPKLSIKAIDLHQFYPTVRPFNLGDSITVKSPIHGVERVLICTVLEINIKDPSKTQYTLTDPNQITLRKDRTLTGSSASTSSTARSAKRSGAGGAAAASLLEKFITEVNGVLTIKDKVVNIESLPGGTLGQITAALTVGDGKIIGNVQNKLNTLSSTITQTEELLTSEIKNTKEGLETKISQTDSSIRADVSDEINDVRGSIELSIKDIDGLKKSVLDIDTDITNINSEITNIKNLYAKKAYVDSLVTSSAIIKLLDGGYVKTAALTTNSADIGYLEVKTMTFGGSTVTKGQVKVVTDFTQASTYGIHLEGDKYVTFLRTSEAFVPTTYTPAYGDTITFN